MLKKLLNRKNVIITFVFILVIFISSFSTCLLEKQKEKDAYEKLADEYADKLEYEKDVYRVESLNIKNQYESDKAAFENMTKVDVSGDYTVIFYEEKLQRYDGDLYAVCPYVYGMEDEKLENKINGKLRKIFVDSISMVFRNCFCSCADVFYSSNKYLCIGVEYKVCESGFFFVDFCTVIDMETGEFVYLDDVIEINEELVKKIMDGEIEVKDGYDEKVYELGQWKSEYETVKSILLQELQDCSEAYEDDFYWHRPYFYIQDGKLWLRNIYIVDPNDEKMHPYFLDWVYIELDEIEDYLKVEKW